jgi:hypothetical protein
MSANKPVQSIQIQKLHGGYWINIDFMRCDCDPEDMGGVALQFMAEVEVSMKDPPHLRALLNWFDDDENLPKTEVRHATGAAYEEYVEQVKADERERAIGEAADAKRESLRHD